MMSQDSGIGGKRRIADQVVLLVLAVMAGFYCYDAISASTHVYNLIMVLPLTVLVLGLCLAQFVVAVRSGEPEGESAENVRDVLPVMMLFTAYVVSLNWLGFDIGTLLFTAVFLWMQGERRWPWLIGYSVAFAFVLTFFFQQMLPYPMPTLIVGLTNPGWPL
jgi:hypothetical protein